MFYRKKKKKSNTVTRVYAKRPTLIYTFHAVRLKLFALNHCLRLCWPNSAENMGLLMTEMSEMPKKGMTCLGQMETMTETMGLEENHFHGICRKLRQKCPPSPPKAARNPHVLHPTLDLLLHPQRRPKNSLLARQQASPLHPRVPLPRDSIVENPPRHPPPGQGRGFELLAPREPLKWTWQERRGRAGGTLLRWEEGGVIRGETAAPVGNCPLEAGRLASWQ